jgi:CheY-like chemotaxis protein
MPKKILLADDSITIQKVVELTFSDGDYEVTAVNNGAKAIQKLSEMRPDIVLSDIIMPEKNGYEVCEFIKSHPEYRSIPVVLLTGTFEPFDPDRAEKAGCDAVVTKPFESQSLIHKIDELINASRSAALATPQPPAVAPQAPDPFAASAPLDPVSPWPAPTAPTPAPLFGSGADSPFAPPAGSPFDSTGDASPSQGPSPHHDADIFGTSSTQAPPLSFTPTPSTPAAEPDAFGGETRAFPRMSFDDLQQTSAPAAATPPPADKDHPSPFSPAAAEASPWETNEPSVPAFGGETRAFPRMSFDDMQPMSTTPAPVVQPPAPAEDPWHVPEPEPQPEVPAFGAETHAFPQLNYDDLHSPASAPSEAKHDQQATPPPSIWDDQPAAAAPSWSSDAGSSQTQHAPADDFPAAAASPFAEPTADEASPFAAGTSEESSSSESQAAYHPEPAAPPWSSSSSAGDSESAADIYEPAGNELSEAQIDRIARRVVQLMSDQLVRNIAWEVIPDLAEMVVKERVRQLEAEEN